MGYNATVLGLAGLLNYWPLTDAAGSTSAADALGSLPATASGTVTFGVAGGVDGTCATFDGSTGYLRVATPTGISTGNSPWSYGFWFKTSANPGANFTGTFGLNIGAANGAYVFLDVRSDGHSLWTGTGNGNAGYTTAGFADGQWHLYFLTYDGTTLTTYFDGYRVATSVPGTLAIGLSNGLDLAWTGSGGDGHFGGQMAGVAAFSVAVPAATIANLYQTWTSFTPARLHYWPLNDAAGSSSAADTQGSLPGTPAGGVTFGVAGGVDGTCASFDGGSTTGITTASPPTGLPLNNSPWTMACWFKTTASQPANYTGLLSWGNWANGSQVADIYLRNDNISVLVGMAAGGTNLQASAPRAFNDGAWHYLVGTHDGTTRRLYFDGTQIASDSPIYALQYGGQPFTIGRGLASDGHYSGSLQDVAVYNYALTAAQVQANYQLVYPPPGPITLRPVAAPRVRDRHPLFQGRPGVAWPAREWPSFTGGVATQATRWGGVPALGTNFTGSGYTGASEIQWPGRGYVAAPDRVTLWYLGTATANAFGQFNCTPVATTALYSESPTDTRGYAVRYGVTGSTFAPYLAIGQAGATYHGVSCGWALTTGHAYAIAISRDRVSGATSFYAWDYDTAGNNLTTGSATDTTAAAAGDGTAVVNQTWGNFTNYTGTLVTAGFTAGVWTLADFLAWVADPLGPVRPSHTTTAGVLLAATAAGSPRFRRIGMDGGIPSHLYTGGFN